MKTPTPREGKAGVPEARRHFISVRAALAHLAAMTFGAAAAVGFVEIATAVARVCGVAA